MDHFNDIPVFERCRGIIRPPNDLQIHFTSDTALSNSETVQKLLEGHSIRELFVFAI